MALLEGIERDGGAVAMTSEGTIVLACGVPVTAAREVRTNTIEGAPESKKLKHGLSFHTDGSINVTEDSPGRISGGVALTANGVLCITTDAPDNDSRRAYLPGVGTVLVNQLGQMHVA